MVMLTVSSLSYAAKKARVLYIEAGTSEMEKARVTRLAKEINEKFPDIDFQVNYIGWHSYAIS